MKRKLIVFSILGTITLLILIRIFNGSGTRTTVSSVVQNPVIPVEVYIASDTSMIYRLTAPGTLRADESVEIVAEISKKVTGIFLKEGTEVYKDQLLFKLDDADIVARINKLDIEETLAVTNESRQKAQLSQGGISQEQYDVTLNHLNMIRSEISILKVDLSKTEIRAPFTGRIGLRNVSLGALVTPGLVLARLQAMDRIKVDFSVPERYANDLRPGGIISFSSDNSTGEQVAMIEAVEPDVEKSTRTISLRAVCMNPGGKFVPGSSVKVTYDLKALHDRLFIPTPALIPSVRGYNVYLVKSGKASLQPVKTGIRNQLWVEITEGLMKKDTVVVTNLLRIKPDAPLKVVKFD